MTTNGTVTVLIIDDNSDLLQLFAQGLPQMGNYVVVTAEDGAAGLALCHERHPDCAVIDIKMPQLTGYQVVRALRGDPETAEMPLIVLTALPADQAAFASLASGCDQFLVKPVLVAELRDAIQQSLAISEADRTRRMQKLAQEG
ncbi:MAG TPA: response regulator [Ktedonobacterales bacterium]|nr:response regulator [Ktedonobacterales bacterium]